MAKKQISTYKYIPGAIPPAYGQYPKAVALLTANKTFLIEEISAYIQQQVTANVANSGSPFYGYVYDSTRILKCKRDVGYLLDGIIYDLTYGGNSGSYQIANRYYVQGVLQIVSPQVEVITQTWLLGKITTNILTNTTYVKVNTSASQTVITGNAGETGSAAQTTTLFNITVNAINSGLSSIPTPVLPNTQSSGLMPSTVALLEANKRYIQEETIAYIAYNATNNIAPYAYYTYNAEKCRRDVSYVLEGYISDLKHGGNRQTYFNATYYWLNGVPQVDGDRLPEVFAHTFIKGLIQNYILTNIAFSSRQTAIAQVVDNGNPAEVFGSTVVALISDIVIDVIKSGLAYAPTKLSNRGSVKFPGFYKLKDVLLITNTSRNIILYNFADPTYKAEVTYIETYDSDFPAALYGNDRVTTITFDADTTNHMVTDNIQIFVESKEQAVRLNPIATDAMERMKVGIPQSMLDADFEYGLQPTKWQALSLMRNYPAIYEVPGSDLAVVSVTTDASTGSGGSGASLITVTTQSSHGLVPGDAITIKALANSVSGFSRSEGSFLLASASGNTMTYYAKSKVGTADGQQLSSTYTQLRKGNFYTGAAIGNPQFSVFSSGVAGTITTSLVSAAGTDTIGFTGTVPPVGAPLTGTGIVSGAQVTAVTGPGGTAASTTLSENASIGDSSFNVTSTTGISQGLVFDRGDGQAVLVTDVTGNTVTLQNPLTSAIVGTSASVLGVTQTSTTGAGSGGIFTISRSGATYTTVATTPGTGYVAGNTITFAGTGLGGSGSNNAVATVGSASPARTVATLDLSTATGGSGYHDQVNVPTTVTGLGAGSTGAGTGLVLDITTAPGAVSTIAIGAAVGTGYYAGDTVTIQQKGVATFSSLGAGVGSGYTTASGLSTSNATGTGLVVDIVAEANDGGVTALDAPLNPGTQYSVGITTTTGGTGSGLTVNIISVGGGGVDSITSFAISNAGTGYTVNDVVTIDGSAGGTPATYTVTQIKVGRITGVTVNFSGTGYNVSDTVTVVQGGNTSATCTVATITGNTSTIQISSVNIGGVIQSISGTTGTPITAPTKNFISAVTISDVTTSQIASGNTGITYTSIATIQVTFASNHGFIPGDTITVSITSADTGAQLASGPFFVEQVPDPTRLRYTARSAGTINNTLTGLLYGRPDSFFVHRPFDGGVQLGTASPSHGATAIRMSKKYIRYQSGKGVMYNTGALFAPSYDLRSLTAAATAVGSVITITTDDTDHGLQVGGVVIISGVQTSGYNGTYSVTDISTERVFRVLAQTTLGSTDAVLGNPCFMSIKNWHGSTVRSGIFDDQNGMFWQYDGQRMAVVRRSSTFQVAGTISISANSNLVTGTNTRFTQQLASGDRIVIRGMTHVVSSVASDTSMSVTPDYRGVSNVVDAKTVKTVDIVIPQENWNIDPLNGSGQSGYNLDVTKMQMIGIQHTWYGAGFIDFMLRGPDGNYVFAHRFRNSNVNTEAYMRTGNQPVRYEVINEGAKGKLVSAMTDIQTTVPLTADDAYWFPTAGTVYIDNELIRYTGNDGANLTGCVRAASLTQFTAGSQRNFTAGIASSHAVGAGVILVSNTITPIISHWGSAFMIDGQFDEDRGYIFNYAATAISVSVDKRTAFLIRLAPSVSNAQIGDLGDRELLNRAQLLLSTIAIASDAVSSVDPFTGNQWSSGGTATSGQYYHHTSSNVKNWYQATGTGTFSSTPPTFTSGNGASGTYGVNLTWAGATPNNAGAIVVEGVLNPQNYPTDPTKITWTGLASSAAGGQPSFAQIASGGSVSWGGNVSTSTATVQGAFTNTIVAKSFAAVTNTLTATSFSQINQTANTPAVTSVQNATYQFAFRNTRNDFLIPQSTFAAFTTPILVGDALSVTTYITGGQTVVSTTANFITINSVAYARVVMSANANATSATNTAINNVNIRSNLSLTYATALSSARTDFLIPQTQYAASTLAVSDVLSVATFLTGGQSVSSITPNYCVFANVAYARIIMTGPANASSISGTGNNATVTATSAATATYGRALSTARNDFLITNAAYAGTGIAVGDVLSLATYITGGQTITSIVPSYITINSVSHTRIVMSAVANSNSTAGSGNDQTVTVTAAGSSATYTTTNYLFFDSTTWLASGATVGTRVASDQTKFPGGTAVAQISTRTYGATTVYRVTFTQTSNSAFAAADTLKFQFGSAYALPGEQVFSFISNPGSTDNLSLDALKELTATAIGGRGTFPNGPDVLAINVYKVSGNATPANIILRWGEAQA